jgi:uncharacterized protein YuzE
MKYMYDATNDSLFIRFREGEYGESEEIYEGFVIDFDKAGRPIALDIYSKASEFVDIEELRRNLPPVEKKISEPAYHIIADAPIGKRLDKKKP